MDKDQRKRIFIGRFAEKAQELRTSVRELCEGDILISFATPTGDEHEYIVKADDATGILEELQDLYEGFDVDEEACRRLDREREDGLSPNLRPILEDAEFTKAFLYHLFDAAQAAMIEMDAH